MIDYLGLKVRHVDSTETGGSSYIVHVAHAAEAIAAGRCSVLRYLASYGPATWANLDYWLTEGLSVPRRRLRTWVAELGDQVTEVM